MVETYQDLDVLVNELRCCFDQYKADSSITDRIKAIITPWVQNPDWIKPEYCRCKTDEDIYPLYEGDKDDILITVICWRKGDEGCVHDHNTWAVIGVAQGQETHTLWHRTDDRTKPGFATVEKGKKVLVDAGNVMTLPNDGLHCVVNNSECESTISLHIYGGDLVKLGRRQYFPDENRYEIMHSMK
ncbi:MAG: cysteine dioxygenase family protein [Coxiellaceae bacterium]|nr:cysteine dioxygenase family protein [Coxiellaceae bacterium]